MRTPPVAFCAAVILLAAGCAGDGDLPRQSRVAANSASATSPAACEDVLVVGSPITGRQLLDGCRSSNGGVVEIPYYPCRGTGNVTAGLVHDGRGWRGELQLDWHEKPAPTDTYGTWGGGGPYVESEHFDVAGCVTQWPDEQAAPSPS